ncbi:MAG: cell envelope integrity protein CreD [Rhodobacteraceae bacterium]|nr:cell envelope integrity protein CreD [Paracoccaceae bacterium]
MANSSETTLASIQRSEAMRLALVALLVLILQIPISMIGGLVSERQDRSHDVATEIGSKWGGEQTITGPVLVVPFAVNVTDLSNAAQPVLRTEMRDAVFLAERLQIRASMKSDTRRRGIFSVPVFDLSVSVNGEFSRPNFSGLTTTPAEIRWDRAYLAVGIRDVRAIQEQAALNWAGGEVPFIPGTGSFTDGGPGIRAPVSVVDTAERFIFDFPLTVRGSRGLFFTPFAKITTVQLETNYAHPSFQGNWLPNDYSVGEKGFQAQWEIPFIGRNYPQSWDSRAQMGDSIGASRFGVLLINPVDHYTMAERSVKYASLFVLLTLAVIWLAEVTAGLRVHPIQYLMVGGALCLFYLLELSLSEHIGFVISYCVASTAVVAMVASYSLVVLRRTRHAFVVAGSVALLYGYLFVLLRNEDYALLIGSIGLFVALAGVMYTTRQVDWYAVRVGGRQEPKNAA